VSILFGETNHVLHARFSPDAKQVVTASADGAARVFDAAGARRSTLAGHTDTVSDAVFSPNGNVVATASVDGTARLWSWRTQPILRLVGRHRGAVVAERFGRDGRIWSAGTEGRIRTWRLPNALLASFGGPTAIRSAAFGGDRVVVTGTDGAARLWRFPGRPEHVFRGAGRISTAALSPGGRTVATADATGHVDLWSSRTGGHVHSFRTGVATRALAFDSYGAHLAAAGADGLVRVWRLDGGRLQYLLRGHRGAIVAVSFSPDGRRVATAGVDHTARIWSAATGNVQRVLRGHKSPLTSLAFSPDGKMLVTTSRDHDGRLWRVASGRRLAVLRVHYSTVPDAAFTADGRWVVTVGGGGAAFFSTTSGRILTLVRTRDHLPLKVATSVSGWRIAVGGTDGYVETYDCRLCGRLDNLMSLARLRLAQLRARDSGGTVARGRPAATTPHS